MGSWSRNPLLNRYTCAEKHHFVERSDFEDRAELEKEVKLMGNRSSISSGDSILTTAVCFKICHIKFSLNRISKPQWLTQREQLSFF